MIAARREEWEEEKVVYEQEKTVVKLAKKRFVGKKLVLGKLPAVISRPKVSSVAEKDSGDSGDGDSDENEGNSEND